MKKIILLLILGCMLASLPQPCLADIFDASSVVIERPSLRKYDYEGGSDVIYYGYNFNPDASDDDTDWVVFKITYTGSDATEIERRTGTWTGRAGLF